MWYKKDAGYWHNPTWLAMPWASALAFDYLLAECKMFGGRDGHVSVSHWRPETILYILRLPVPVEDIREAMDALEASGKVVIADGKVAVAEWREYQTDPTNADRQKKHRVTVKSRTDGNCDKTERNSYVTQHNTEVTPRNVSNGEIDRIDRSEREDSSEPGPAASEQVSLPLVPLTTRQEEAMRALREEIFQVSGWDRPQGTVLAILGDKKTADLARVLGGSAYPAVIVGQTIATAAAWTLANPSKAKTKNGMAKFLNSWFGREQDRGGTRVAAAPSVPAPTPVGQATKPRLTPYPTAAEEAAEMRRIQEMHERLTAEQAKRDEGHGNGPADA